MEAALAGEAGWTIRSYVGWTMPYSKEGIQRAVYDMRRRNLKPLVYITGSGRHTLEVCRWCYTCGERTLDSHTHAQYNTCAHCGHMRACQHVRTD
jgi:hypothetical protein